MITTMNEFKIILVTLINLNFVFGESCTYWDSIHGRQTVYCPQTCCIRAESYENVCCYGWAWWIALISIGFPILVTIIVIIFLCYLVRRRRQFTYSGRVLNVDPMTNPAFSQNPAGAPPVYTVFPVPPAYSIQTINPNPSNIDSPIETVYVEPPSYSSVIKFSRNTTGNINQPQDSILQPQSQDQPQQQQINTTTNTETENINRSNGNNKT